MSEKASTMPGSRFILGPNKDLNDPEKLPDVMSSCQDLNGRTFPSGSHFVPGPDTCTVCVCDDGGPKWCQAVLCAPPQDCKSFRVGTSCCDFICVDDYLEGGDASGGGRIGADLGLRLIASAVAAILSLGLLFFLVHRLRGKRRQAGRNNNWRGCESLASMGYLSGSAAYLNGQDRVEFMEEPPPHFVFWKPPNAYVPPPGEAPPPYSEVVSNNEPLRETEEEVPLGDVGQVEQGFLSYIWYLSVIVTPLNK
ncbi:hypothetical protein QYM36_009534 [Artemia franciscana]|uniref:Integral membrane protein DGCR2/IDD n=1 Tax=Artemia franciscana TaxID=6661 RepID=A0AA88HR38_ARTSF|nr:hypothetical protein QYM36_009534 [Artemia franciscana]